MGLLDANFAALALILHNILVNFSFSDRILTIFAALEQSFNDFQHGVRCPTRLLARRRVRSTLNIYIYIYIYIYIHTYTYIYIYIYFYRKRERERVKERLGFP